MILALGPLAAGAVDKPEGPVTGPIDPIRICMLNNFVVKTKNGTVPYIYKGKTYHFCCAGCLMRFAANPDVQSKAVDLVNKQSVIKATAVLYALQDTVYYFSSASTMQQFAKNPSEYLDPKKDEAKTKEPSATPVVVPQPEAAEETVPTPSKKGP